MKKIKPIYYTAGLLILSNIVCIYFIVTLEIANKKTAKKIDAATIQIYDAKNEIEDLKEDLSKTKSELGDLESRIDDLESYRHTSYTITTSTQSTNE